MSVPNFQRNLAIWLARVKRISQQLVWASGDKTALVFLTALTLLIAGVFFWFALVVPLTSPGSLPEQVRSLEIAEGKKALQRIIKESSERTQPGGRRFTDHDRFFVVPSSSPHAS